LNIWIEALATIGFYFVTTSALQWVCSRISRTDSSLFNESIARLCGLGALGLWCWIAYIFSLPFWLLHGVPGILVIVFLVRLVPRISGKNRSREISLFPDALHLIAILGLFSLLLTVSIISGGGWAGDWIEHFERSQLFFKNLPPETMFLSDHYTLTARPPLANGLCAFFSLPSGGTFAGYQIVMLLLSSEVLRGAFALLGLKPGIRRSTLCLLAFLVLASPVFVQNALFPWTKSLTAAFVLGGLAALGGYLKRPDTRSLLIFGFLLAVGILTHYSAAVFLPGAVAIILWNEWRLRRNGGFLKRVIPGAVTGAVVICSWIGWTFFEFGFAESFSATTTVSDVKGLTPGENVAKILANTRDTVVPHFAREISPDTQRVTFSEHPFISLRDYLFNLSQTNLLFFGGISVPMIFAGFIVFRNLPLGRLVRSYLLIAAISVPLGIAVHGARDSIGLMHICLQPLLYMAFIWIAAQADRFSSGFLVLILTLTTAGLCIETGLHTAILSFDMADWIAFHPDIQSYESVIETLGVNLGHNALSLIASGYDLAGVRSGSSWIAGFGIYVLSCGLLLVGFFRSTRGPLLDEERNNRSS